VVAVDADDRLSRDATAFILKWGEVLMSRFGSRLAFAVVLITDISYFAAAQVNVTTYHNDIARSGLNSQESVLSPHTVKSKFKKLFSQPVDGAIYGQPLYLSGVNLPDGKGTHNIVYVATEHDSVYAFDADSSSANNAAPLWQASFINPAANITAVPSSVINCFNIAPEVGITSTPVIDPATGTLYVVAKSSENGTIVQRLHALDVTTGGEKFGGPVAIQASVLNPAGRTIAFNAAQQNQRAGLLLLNGAVYIAWGSHCDHQPYYGWVMAYSASTLQQLGVWNAAPGSGKGGIWMGGAGLASDGTFVYLVTGDGKFNADIGGVNHGEAIIKLGAPTSGTLPVLDYFAPYNGAALSSTNSDFGSAGIILLPNQPSTAPYTHLAAVASKSGTLYLVNRDNLGGFNSSGDEIVQELPSVMEPSFGGPAFWKNTFYCGSRGVLRAFSFDSTTGLFSTSPTSQTALRFQYAPPSPSVSADANSGGIVWVVQTNNFTTGGPAILHAYNANNLQNQLYVSEGADVPGPAVVFSVPTIANGKVYVGTANQLSVYGLR
jgi:hypothetical protein